MRIYPGALAPVYAAPSAVVPSWVTPNALVDLDFVSGQFYGAQPFNGAVEPMVVNLPSSIASACSLFVQGVSDAAAVPANRVAAVLDDGTSSNRVYLRRANTSMLLGGLVDTGGVNQTSRVGVAWNPSVRKKVMVRAQTNLATVAYDGTVGSAATTLTFPSALVRLIIGSAISGAQNWTGTIERVTVWSSYISDGLAQTYTT
jgi:hypothetical protein